jgi:hypothetical protein
LQHRGARIFDAKENEGIVPGYPHKSLKSLFISPIGANDRTRFTVYARRPNGTGAQKLNRIEGAICYNLQKSARLRCERRRAWSPARPDLSNHPVRSLGSVDRELAGPIGVSR